MDVWCFVVSGMKVDEVAAMNGDDEEGLRRKEKISPEVVA